MLRNLQKIRHICKLNASHSLSTSATHSNEPQGERKMGAWQIHAYDDDLQYSDKIKLPAITGSNDVLIKISAASINPIDIAMSSKWSRIFLLKVNTQ